MFNLTNQSSTRTHLINPELSYNDVMNGSDTLAPGVVTLGLVEDQVTGPQRQYGHILSSEVVSCSVLLPECPISALSVLSKHWWMVTHLGERERGSEGSVYTYIQCTH